MFCWVVALEACLALWRIQTMLELGRAALARVTDKVGSKARLLQRRFRPSQGGEIAAMPREVA